MPSRDDIKRLLETTGSPPSLDLPGLERSVWGRLDGDRRTVDLPWWQGWTLAGWLAAAIACGLLSAAWRVGAIGPGGVDAHAQYLQLIDPLVRSAADLRS